MPTTMRDGRRAVVDDYIITVTDYAAFIVVPATGVPNDRPAACTTVAPNEADGSDPGQPKRRHAVSQTPLGATEHILTVTQVPRPDIRRYPLCRVPAHALHRCPNTCFTRRIVRPPNRVRAATVTCSSRQIRAFLWHHLAPVRPRAWRIRRAARRNQDRRFADAGRRFSR
jgi:hypothetical protein